MWHHLRVENAARTSEALGKALEDVRLPAHVYGPPHLTLGEDANGHRGVWVAYGVDEGKVAPQKLLTFVRNVEARVIQADPDLLPYVRFHAHVATSTKKTARDRLAHGAA
jgi:hypothetical protein